MPPSKAGADPGRPTNATPKTAVAHSYVPLALQASTDKLATAQVTYNTASLAMKSNGHYAVNSLSVFLQFFSLFRLLPQAHVFGFIF